MGKAQGETGLRGRHAISLKSRHLKTDELKSSSNELFSEKRGRRYVVDLLFAWRKVSFSESLRSFGLVVIAAYVAVSTSYPIRTEPRNETSKATPRVVALTKGGAEPLIFNLTVQHQFRLRRAALLSKDQKNASLHEREDYCKPMYDWQEMSFPTCNKLHEHELTGTNFDNGSIHPRGSILMNNGNFRDVWSISEFDGEERVIKTIREEYDFSRSDIEKERRDAVAMERLTSSLHIPNIFGYCAGSGIFELTTEGDLMSHIWDEQWRDKTTQQNRLTIAVQVAAALADVHSLNIAHTDIAAKQFILIDGVYKLNDFNRCKFLEWNDQKNETCTFYVSKNPGKSRSPEEYEYENLTNMIDVYSMGNIFYSLLMGIKVFDGVKTKTAQKIVMNKGRPKLSSTLRNSKDPIDIALMKAMSMCQQQEPNNRATAAEVYSFLSSEAKKLGVPDILKNEDTEQTSARTSVIKYS